ncbi:MAG: hypothetical protein KZY61_07720 [Clostridiaceae bacterium]|nr:hypothetical protein [Clostridiaceae bacterium]MBW4859567.1 hypothetical protein [Clostridiaceae bacterium]MBW4868536.1 hypothetical protein [Clostridiaceae bacterium]
MRKRRVPWIKFLTIVMCLSLFLVGCNTSKKAPKKVTETPKVKNEVTPKVKDEAERREDEDEDKDNIPDSLDDIEDDAGDIVEYISKDDWAKVDERLSAIEKNWSTYEPMAKEMKASQDDINKFRDDLNNLKKEVRDKKPHEATLAANKLAIASLDFMKLYEKKFLVDIEKMELYGKQMMFTAEHDDWNQCKVELKSSMEIWNKIKAEADKINSDTTKKVSDTMTKISGAIDAKDARKVKDLLETLDHELDILEDDFKR